MLRSLGVPTLRVLGSTDRALLLEDLEGGNYRPGRPEDLDDPEAAALIARWYRELHGRGYAHVESAGEGLYDENDALTAENIEAVRARTGELPVWRLIEANWGKIRAAIDGARRTLTYNDFYYTNLAVARDGSSALMFDYGLLGKGYAYADIRNVLSSLSPAAGEAFLAGYGPFDAREEQIDGVANVLLGLYWAYGARGAAALGGGAARGAARRHVRARGAAHRGIKIFSRRITFPPAGASLSVRA